MDTEDNCKEDDIQANSRRKLDFENGIDMNTCVQDENVEEEVLECVEGNEKVDYVHSKIRKELIPVIGLEFDTENDAYNFYNAYAYGVGFSIRRCKFHKDKSGKFLDRLFVCSAEGKRDSEKDKRFRNVKAHRAETRFGCLARMKIKLWKASGKYCVVEFVSKHNGHQTSSPSKSYFFRSHRSVNTAQIAEADMAYDSGIPPKATFEFLSRQAGGRESLGFIPEDYTNYLRSKRTRQMMVGDTGGVLEYLQKKQLSDPNFFHAIQVDEDDLITNIFWVDAKMMVDYDYFGDVVCFDTTYRKNKEGRPFAMFVGVNNHKQTVVFGAALLYDETTETFMWLFDTFSKAMSGKKPKTVLTDQDATMAKALASEWPEACHRLCIWHIYQNAAKHLSSVFEKFNDFAQDFSSCIYDYEDEDDFLNAWNVMLEKYDLMGNDWLKRLFDLKEKWALVYGRETFCGDITTTQRSESMNGSLKKYVNYRYDLLRFFHHFERLIEDRRYKELRADFKASQSFPAISFPVKILRHAAKVYTPAVFKKFQYELCKAHDCVLSFIDEIGTVSSYHIMPHGKSWHHRVTFDSTSDIVQCSCKKFQFAGILCAHALKVLSTRNLKKIPSQYILKRWTKSVKEGKRPYLSCQNTSEIDPKGEIVRRYRDICRLSTQIATRAAGSKRAYELVLSRLDSIREDVDTCLKEEGEENSTQVISPTTNNASELKEVVCVDDADLKKVKGIKVKERLKGIGCSSRPKNALEKLTMGKRRRLENKDTNSSTVASKNASTTQCVSVTRSVLATQHIPSTQSLLPLSMQRVSNVQLTLPLSQPILPSAPLLQLEPNCGNLTMDVPIKQRELPQTPFMQHSQSTMDVTSAMSLLPGASKLSQKLLSGDSLGMNFQANKPQLMPFAQQVHFPQQQNLGVYNTISNYHQLLQRQSKVAASMENGHLVETGERLQFHKQN